MKSLFRFALLLVLAISVPALRAQSNPVIPEAHVSFTTIDVPGAGYTVIWGINTAGDIVGNYGQNTLNDAHGFLYKDGTFTYFDYPGENETVPRAINDSGLIAGYAGDIAVVGFLYDGTGFTTIQHGGDDATFVNGVNNAGELVGGTGTVGATKGFKMRDGHFKILSVPGSYIYEYGTGISNHGQIAGWIDDDSFLCRADGCQVFDVPGASKTEALGINDKGVIVGWYDQAPFSYGFVRKDGKYLSLSYPGARATAGSGINASGQVVGSYTFDYQTYHGFVTSPVTATDSKELGCCQAAADWEGH